MPYVLWHANQSLKPRLTHTEECVYWKDEKKCNCGFDSFSLNEHIKKDLENIFNIHARENCEFCKADFKKRPTKRPDGYYHKVSDDGLSCSEYCENSGFYFVLDEL